MNYKKLYLEEKKFIKRFLKHRVCPDNCKWCREDYKAVIDATKKYVKDKKLRENLLDLWETLKINREHNFDIIHYQLAWNLRKR